jgi:membrane protease YdiL (CAAX protease family)
MQMKAIFNNPIDGRLRAGWRIFLFLIIFLSLSLLIFPIRPLFGDISKKAFIEDYSIIVIMVLTFSAFIAVAIARRYFDRATFTSLGLTLDTRAILDLCFGFILSAAMAAIVYSLMITLGFIEFKGFNLNSTSGANGLSFDFVQFMSIISIGSIAILLFETILVGIWEELVFRGYLFQNMVAGMGTTIAVIVSCLLYGWIHSMNPNAGILSSSIIILFGFLRL